MSRKPICSIISFILFFSLVLSCSVEENDEFSERVKISLREIGNQLLLSNQDSTSLIQPVIALGQSKYRVSFQKDLSFDPDRLVSIVTNTFQKSTLPKNYRVEVIQCVDDEVAYSYQISADKESTIIPCIGRVLPSGCYTIDIRFTEKILTRYSQQAIVCAVLLGIFMLLLLVFYRRKKVTNTEEAQKNYTKIGSFQFYAKQNKLVQEAREISLSKKECELLEIFVANPNQIIRRDELTKRVWEDQGVFVGRSLDTYISKLRKKLKGDISIKLTNVHGVGYKLEMNKTK